MKIKTWIKEIEKRKKAIAAERDRLVDLISEAEDLRENCDSALEDIQAAIDTLSELV